MLTLVQKDLGLKSLICVLFKSNILGTNSTHTFLVGNGLLDLLKNQDATQAAALTTAAIKVENIITIHLCRYKNLTIFPI